MNLRNGSLSPMMAQWYHCKKEAKDALLLFRLGDFYEAFYDDAIVLSRELGLTLTQRQQIPMSGIPVHTSENYIEKLVAKGFLVAIAEQVEDPKQTKGLVKREVVRTVSPGTIMSESFLKDKNNNFFACLTHVNATFALALLDLSTGEFSTLEFEEEGEVQDELFRRRSSELLISTKTATDFSSLLKELRKKLTFRLNIKEDSYFTYKECYRTLVSHFSISHLDSFTVKGMTASIHAAGALLDHVRRDLNLPIDHIKEMKLENLSTYMAIDQTTQTNLELIEPLHPQNREYTLLKLLDRTKTAMGGRLLRHWITHPLLSVSEIESRQIGIKELISHPDQRDLLLEKLKNIRDLERLINRISARCSTPRDLSRLKESLTQIPPILSILTAFKASLLIEIKENLPPLSPVADLIANALVDDPPAKNGDSPIIREGFSHKLDAIRKLKGESQSWIANYQTELKKTTGVKTLKIIYSRAFGYCIEVSRSQASRIPNTFERRQTLVNAERFISPQLKAYEEQILDAEEKIQKLEQKLYTELKQEVTSHLKDVKKAAKAIAQIDTLLSLAEVAERHLYTCPKVDDSRILKIEGGRHPVIEATFSDSSFIPNDTLLDPSIHSLLLITGPNMGGKSTYIRQVALISILAQMGSFIPATSAHIGIIDKVFSRIGASDNLSQGHSTFMVEMTETAHILKNATPDSLIILDEVGRGTSTYDGIAIAHAVAEHLAQLDKKGVKTLFATHYLELTELENTLPQVKNLNVAIKESKEGITFLHKITSGSADKSYGIHVAKLARFPRKVIKRAEGLLKELEKESCKIPNKEERQPSLFDLIERKKGRGEEIALKELKEINLNETTPLDALQILSRLQEKITNAP